MGKNKNSKISKRQPINPPLMDPVLIKAFARGRDAGLKEGKKEGQLMGSADMIVLHMKWISEMDKHIPGIGEKRKLEIQKYIYNRMQETIDDNRDIGIQKNFIPDDIKLTSGE